MKMRGVAWVALVFGMGLSITSASVARGQESVVQLKKVFGYLDPKTGTFVAATPMAHPDASTTPATSGTITLTLTMKLVTAFPAKSTIVCGVNLQVLSMTQNMANFTATDGQWLESASSLATISGSTATCKVSIPYAWVLPAAVSSATVTTTNTLSAGFLVTVSNATTPTVLRTTQQDLIEGEPVPATGSVTNYTASVTL